MPENPSKIQIATFNANSIRTRLDQILGWMSATQADVLCVQETKVQDSDFPQEAFQEAGLHVAFSGQKSHAGVAIISRTPPRMSCAVLTMTVRPIAPGCSGHAFRASM